MAATLKLTLSYNANGGSGAPSPTTVSGIYSSAGTKSLTVNASSTKPTRTGYNFTGWSPSSVTKSYNITQTAIDNNLTFTLTASTTAQWSLKTYAVNYDANGGTGAPSKQTKTYGKTLTLSSTEPTKSGYRFSKWNTAADGSGTNYNPGGSYTSNSAITLYAVWEKVVSDVYCGNSTMGTSTSITITNNTTGTITNTITYKFGSATGTVATKTSSTTVAFTFPTSLGSQIPTATSGTCTLTIETFVNGASVGKNTGTFKLSVPSYNPSLSISYTDTNATAMGIGLFVQGKSRLNCSVTTSSSYGATVSSFSVNINGTNYSSSSFTTGLLSNSGSNTWTASVTDSRNKTKNYSGTFSVTAYSEPSVTIYVTRDESNESQAVITTLHSVSQLAGNNTNNYYFDWESGTASGSWGSTYSGSETRTISVAFDTSTEITCTVSDLFGEYTAYFTLPAADSIIFRVDHETKAVSFYHDVYGRNGLKFIDESAVNYNAGETVTLSGIYSGFVTSGGVQLRFFVPTLKNTMSVSWAVTAFTGGIRTSSGGYVGSNANDSTNWLNESNLDRIEVTALYSGLRIIVYGKSAWTGGGIVNNTPLSFNLTSLQLITS